MLSRGDDAHSDFVGLPILRHRLLRQHLERFVS